ncbi:MAG: RDD family protein, partial [Thioalkalispiraceae bacterium]
MQNSIKSHASLLRRLAALVYDGLLLFAVTMVAGFLITPFLGEINIENQGTNETIFNPLMLAYYLIVYYLFFTWFWTHGGQTLGMRAWHTRLLTSDGKLVNWKQALFRF